MRFQLIKVSFCQLSLLFYINSVCHGFTNVYNSLSRINACVPVATPSLWNLERTLRQERSTQLQMTNNESEENSKETSSDHLAKSLGNPWKATKFSGYMILSGAVLGPFLDSYHSNFGVLQYDKPIQLQLWGSDLNPALITSWWVPALFGVAGFIIGWLYVLLDQILITPKLNREKSPPIVLLGISLFTAQYWLSGVMFSLGLQRSIILGTMTFIATLVFTAFDCSVSGFLTSTATAFGGPLIEICLLSFLRDGGYHYKDLGELGFFPLWIVPVYFCGGPAVGNLARSIWNSLSDSDCDSKLNSEIVNSQSVTLTPPGCQICKDSRCVECSNCDGQGYYVTYDRTVKCKACSGRGLVICRSCFSYYGDDPSDLNRIRDIMSKIPD